MDIANADDRRFLQLAVLTVMHINRHHIHLNREPRQERYFIKDMASDIISRAERFKEITNCSIEEIYATSNK